MDKFKDNKKVGLFLGYPEDCVKVYLKSDNDYPRNYLDNLSDMDLKKLHYLIPYQVPSKEKAKDALRKSNKRYSKLEELDNQYHNYIVNRSIEENPSLSEEEIREHIDSDKHLTSLIEEANLENGTCVDKIRRVI